MARAGEEEEGEGREGEGQGISRTCNKDDKTLLGGGLAALQGVMDGCAGGPRAFQGVVGGPAAF